MIPDYRNTDCLDQKPDGSGQRDLGPIMGMALEDILAIGFTLLAGPMPQITSSGRFFLIARAADAWAHPASRMSMLPQLRFILKGPTGRGPTSVRANDHTLQPRRCITAMKKPSTL